MKYIFLTIFIFLFNLNFVKSQSLEFDLSYKYINSDQWDKIIQTYNFSRPLLANKQPLFTHGLNASCSYLFSSHHKIKHGIIFSYSFFRSLANNDNFKNVLNLHFLNLGYLLHCNYSNIGNGFYSELSLSLTTHGLFRRVNDSPFLVDGIQEKCYGIGGDINFKTGYPIRLNKNLSLSPFFMLGYTPYLYSPNSETVINQTSGLINEDWMRILGFQVGVGVCLSKNGE